MTEWSISKLFMIKFTWTKSKDELCFNILRISTIQCAFVQILWRFNFFQKKIILDVCHWFYSRGILKKQKWTLKCSNNLISHLVAGLSSSSECKNPLRIIGEGFNLNSTFPGAVFIKILRSLNLFHTRSTHPVAPSKKQSHWEADAGSGYWMKCWKPGSLTKFVFWTFY